MSPQLTQAEVKALRRVYNFQKPRRFRYGLNIRYIGVSEEVVERLRQKGLVWYKYRYGHRYVFLTRAGRQVVENA